MFTKYNHDNFNKKIKFPIVRAWKKKHQPDQSGEIT